MTVYTVDMVVVTSVACMLSGNGLCCELFLCRTSEFLNVKK